MADTTTVEIAIDQIKVKLDYKAEDKDKKVKTAKGRLDETILYGYGFASDGTTATNCWGHPIDEYGNVTDETVFIQ